METKQMAFAGSWYPATAQECRPFIESCIKESQLPEKEFVGGIVPHAGWYFSGSIACRVIAALQSGSPVDTVVLFGGHMHEKSTPFLISHGAFETPFGTIPVDSELSDILSRDKTVQKLSPAQFPDENTFELQNPFIKYFFPDAKIVVCAVPPTDEASSIGQAVVNAALKLGRTIRVIGSTDMTHYGPNFGLITAGTGSQAVKWVEKENDRCAIDAMLRMDESGIIRCGLDNKSMCCPGAAAAAVAACRVLNAGQPLEVAYATSYEKSASDSFVGYSGILYEKIV